jgi:hypothetical protein
MLNGPDRWNRRRNILSSSYVVILDTGLSRSATNGLSLIHYQDVSTLNIELANTGGSIGGG